MSRRLLAKLQFPAGKFALTRPAIPQSLRFRGRQMAHRDLGYKIINRLIQDIGDAGVVEFMPRMEGTILHAILAPGKKEAPKQKPAPTVQAPVAAEFLEPNSLHLAAGLPYANLARCLSDA